MRFDPKNTSNPFISADGSKVVFAALQRLSNGKHWHVIVRDVRTNALSRADLSPAGVLGNGDSRPMGISADGRHVLFVSNAPNFGHGDSGVYERDLARHTTVLVSVPPPGERWSAAAPEGMSRDGRYVALVAGGDFQVWLRDVVGKTSTLVTRGAGGVPGNDVSDQADVSPDGSQVVFASSASNLVTGDTNGKPDVFLWSRHSHTINRLSVASDGSQLGEGSSLAKFTPDGGLITFASDARLTADACAPGKKGTLDSFNGRNTYVLDPLDNYVRHPKQDCGKLERDGELAASRAATTVAVGAWRRDEYPTAIVRVGGAERALGYPSTPTSITANGRYVAVNHWYPLDNSAQDPAAGALIWDLQLRQVVPAWLAHISPGR